MSIITLLVGLIIVCLLYWAVVLILRAFGVGDPIATVVKVIFVILVVFWLLGMLGYAPMLRLR